MLSVRDGAASYAVSFCRALSGQSLIAAPLPSYAATTEEQVAANSAAIAQNKTNIAANKTAIESNQSGIRAVTRTVEAQQASISGKGGTDRPK